MLTYLSIVGALGTAAIGVLVYRAVRTWLAHHADRVRHLEEVNQQTRELHEQQSLRLQAELVLRERDQQFRAVFDNALDALLVVDDERRLVDANPAARTMLKVSSDALPPIAIEMFLDPASAAGIAERWPASLQSRQDKGELILLVEGENAPSNSASPRPSCRAATCSSGATYPSASSSRRSCSSRRSWKPSAGSPEASRTTSTTSSR